MDLQPILLVAIAAVFYFLVYRPQQKTKKEQDVFLDELKKGQRVATSSGVIGKITEITELTVTLSLDGRATCQVTKGSISKEMSEAIVETKS